MNENQANVLEVKNLHTNFYTEQGVVRAANGLSYSVREGEFAALVGESACGKSMSAMAVMGLIPSPPGVIEGGEILFKGENLLDASEARMRVVRGNEIAMVFQEPMTSLNPVLTIGKQVAEALILHKNMKKSEALKESVRLLKLVGIPDAEQRLSDYPGQFSGGMCQRIMIAMAISCHPSLLIADEPTTALDVTVQAQILELLDRLRTEYNTAILVITHNLGIVARYADRVNVMYAGDVVESAPTEEIFEKPMHPYTIGLLASVPRLDKASADNVRAIPGQPPNLACLPKGCPFEPRCAFASERCRSEKPAFEEVGDQHFKACFCETSEILSKILEKDNEQQ